MINIHLPSLPKNPFSISKNQHIGGKLSWWDISKVKHPQPFISPMLISPPFIFFPLSFCTYMGEGLWDLFIFNISFFSFIIKLWHILTSCYILMFFIKYMCGHRSQWHGSLHANKLVSSSSIASNLAHVNHCRAHGLANCFLIWIMYPYWEDLGTQKLPRMDERTCLQVGSSHTTSPSLEYVLWD